VTGRPYLFPEILPEAFSVEHHTEIVLVVALLAYIEDM
jgi:hypothetical protein